MPIIFPPHRQADQSGLLAIGGNLKTETILSAYRQGIFPWPIDSHLAWFSPPERFILDFQKLKISSSLKKSFKKTEFEFKNNIAFEKVIRNCATSAKRKTEGTWITPRLEAAYIKLHKLGHCHSFECYHDGELVGGVYGLCIGKMFCAESMFYSKPNASKLALLAMFAYLVELGFEWLDCQQESALLTRFGASLIPRNEFLVLLDSAIKIETKLNKLDSSEFERLIRQLLISRVRAQHA